MSYGSEERTDLSGLLTEATEHAQMPSCHLSIMHNCVFKLNCHGTLLQGEHRLKWLMGGPWEESEEALEAGAHKQEENGTLQARESKGGGPLPTHTPSGVFG